MEKLVREARVSLCERERRQPNLRPFPSVLGIGNASTPGDYRDNIVRVGFNYQFGPLGGPGVLKSPLPARAAFAWNGDVLPNLNFAIDRSNTQVAAAGLARSSDQAPAKRVAAHDVAVRSAPAASEASAPIATQTSPEASDATTGRLGRERLAGDRRR